MTITSILIGIATAVAGWAALQFLGRPLTRYLEIRTGVFKALAKFNDPMPGEHNDAAKNQLLESAADLVAFAENEPFASWLLRFANIRPRSAASSLQNLSEYWGWENTDYDAYRSDIRDALSFSMPRGSSKSVPW
jgi:hypothetical protein